MQVDWGGEKPLPFLREFLALKAQATATSKSQLISSIVLQTINLRKTLWRSTRSLLQGILAAVAQIFKFKQNVLNSSLANPPIIY